MPDQITSHRLSRSANGQSLCLPHQSFQVIRENDCQYLQVALAGRIILQVDQAESEDQIIYRHQQECGADTSLDSDVCLSDPRIHQVPVEVEEKHATDFAAIAAKFVRKTRLDGIAARRSTGDVMAQYSADSFAVKVNGTAVK